MQNILSKSEIKAIGSRFSESKTPLQFLDYIYTYGLAETVPNLSIALRILALPVSVAMAERSFSKLKLLKTYLRAAMA